MNDEQRPRSFHILSRVTCPDCGADNFVHDYAVGRRLLCWRCQGYFGWDNDQWRWLCLPTKTSRADRLVGVLESMG